MKKIVKQWGELGMGIYLDKEDKKIYNLEVGDVLDISIEKVNPEWEKMKK